MTLSLDFNIGGRRIFSRDAGGPSPLYVYRKVIRGAPELYLWARRLGLKDLTQPSDMHVIVAYSRAPIDWFVIDGDAYDIAIKGGPRRLETFANGVVVLRLKSLRLERRWQELRRAGCSWDWPEYAPHVTLANDAAAVDLDHVEAYAEDLLLGPEIFAPLK